MSVESSNQNYICKTNTNEFSVVYTIFTNMWRAITVSFPIINLWFQSPSEFFYDRNHILVQRIAKQNLQIIIFKLYHI